MDQRTKTVASYELSCIRILVASYTPNVYYNVSQSIVSNKNT